jgi:hypothetical protein
MQLEMMASTDSSGGGRFRGLDRRLRWGGLAGQQQPLVSAGSGVSTAASDGLGSQVQQQPLASAGSGVSTAASDGLGSQVQQQPLASAGSGMQQDAAAP